MIHRTFIKLILLLIIAKQSVEGWNIPAKHIKKTIETEEGDVIDCVNINKQPSLNHKRFKNYKIHMKPNITAKALFGAHTKRVEFDSSFDRSGGCPENSVPILRLKKGTDISANGSNYGALAATLPGVAMYSDVQYPRREDAYGHTFLGPYLGAQGQVYVWDIHVEPNEWSNNFLLVASSTDRSFRGWGMPPDINNQIQIGTMVDPRRWGDSKTRIYMYMTSDGGRTVNCINNECPHFVHTSSKQYFGRYFTHSSIAGDQNWEVPVGVHRDSALPIWWVSINMDEVGYFTDDAFDRFYQSVYHGFGGAVLNTQPGGKHTKTQMGSGAFPYSGLWYSGTIANYLAIDAANGQLTVDTPTGSVVTESRCYDYKKFEGRLTKYPGDVVFYGGPGGPLCDTRPKLSPC